MKGVKHPYSNVDFFEGANGTFVFFVDVLVEFTVIMCERRRREQTFLDSLLPIAVRADGISAASNMLCTGLAELHSANDSSARRCGPPKSRGPQT